MTAATAVDETRVDLWQSALECFDVVAWALENGTPKLAEALAADYKVLLQGMPADHRQRIVADLRGPRPQLLGRPKSRPALRALKDAQLAVRLDGEVPRWARPVGAPAGGGNDFGFCVGLLGHSHRLNLTSKAAVC